MPVGHHELFGQRREERAEAFIIVTERGLVGDDGTLVVRGRLAVGAGGIGAARSAIGAHRTTATVSPPCSA